MAIQVWNQWLLSQELTKETIKEAAKKGVEYLRKYLEKQLLLPQPKAFQNLYPNTLELDLQAILIALAKQSNSPPNMVQSWEYFHIWRVKEGYNKDRQ